MSLSEGFINHGILAENNWIELLGPVIIFGIYAIGAIAKKAADSRRSDSEEKPPTDLQKAVRRRYQEIYAKQTGQQQPTQPARRAEPVKTTPEIRPIQPQQPPKFVSQPQPRVKQRSYDVPQIRTERRPQPVQPQRQVRKTPQPKPVSAPVLHAAKKTAIHPLKKPAEPCSMEHSLASMIRKPKNLQTAILLKEILDKPLALRDF